MRHNWTLEQIEAVVPGARVEIPPDGFITIGRVFKPYRLDGGGGYNAMIEGTLENSGEYGRGIGICSCDPNTLVLPSENKKEEA